MTVTFSQFIIQLSDALSMENGPTLAYLLRPTNPHGKDFVKEFRNPTVSYGLYYYGLDRAIDTDENKS
jgi:COP9 signalosome complex subunit 12